MEDAYLIAKMNMQGCSGVVIKDGILYSCNTTPKFLSIPKGVTELYNGCLSGQDNLVSVTLPCTICNVGLACLANCPSLKTIKCKCNYTNFVKNLMSGNKGVIVDVYISK